jgi:hypothetical protein
MKKQSDTPGGSAGVWVKIQACKTTPTASGTAPAPAPTATAEPTTEGADKSGVAPVKVPRPQASASVAASNAKATPAKSSRFFRQ